MCGLDRARPGFSHRWGGFRGHPTRNDASWREFITRYETRYNEKADHFAALAYDQMQILLKAICEAGLNRALIRDALYGLRTYKGVPGSMVFDPSNKDIRPLYLGTIHDGQIHYRIATMEKPYAQVGEGGVTYAGPRPKPLPEMKYRSRSSGRMPTESDLA